jgi:hypothetical protein
MQAVNQSLNGAGLTGVQVTSAGCLAGTDGNSFNNKPYPVSAFPTTPQSVNVYICYTPPSPPGGSLLSSRLLAPTDNSWRLGDINVALLMNFQLITPFLQTMFGNGINLAYNEHFTIQGKP